eukprot:COSAG05_NODE_2374_length_3159_cov_2.026471_5_plen_203_part_01
MSHSTLRNARNSAPVGSKDWFMAQHDHAKAAKQRLLRKNQSNPETALRLVEAGRTSAEYGLFFVEDMRAALRAYLEHKPRPGKQEKPSIRGLAERYSVRYASLNRYIHKAQGTGPFAPEAKWFHKTNGRTFAWDDVELLDSKAGKSAYVPKEIEDRLAGWFSTAALNTSAEDTQEGGRILLAEMEANGYDIPVDWAMAGTPNA